jgi:hypothetical protein
LADRNDIVGARAPAIIFINVSCDPLQLQIIDPVIPCLRMEVEWQSRPEQNTEQRYERCKSTGGPEHDVAYLH